MRDIIIMFMSGAISFVFNMALVLLNNGECFDENALGILLIGISIIKDSLIVMWYLNTIL